MNERVEISNSEWEVMRILWTLQAATSRQIIDLLAEKLGWKEATTKTYISRLVTKKYVKTEKRGRAYLYLPAVEEEATITEQLLASFAKICQKHIGQTLANVVREIPLSQADIEEVSRILTAKQKTAPLELECDCLPKRHKAKYC